MGIHRLSLFALVTETESFIDALPEELRGRFRSLAGNIFEISRSLEKLHPERVPTEKWSEATRTVKRSESALRELLEMSDTETVINS